MILSSRDYEIIRQAMQRKEDQRKSLASAYKRLGEMPGCHRNTCIVCRKFFYCIHPRAKCCSAQCRAAHAVELQRQLRDFHRAQRHPSPQLCPTCGKVFAPARHGHKHCSLNCRVKAWRKSNPTAAKAQKPRVRYPKDSRASARRASRRKLAKRS